MLLFAEEGAGSWLSALSQINLWGFVVICVVCTSVCAAATDITRRVLRHRERIAMIQAGMNPNQNTAASDE